MKKNLIEFQILMVDKSSNEMLVRKEKADNPIHTFHCEEDVLSFISQFEAYWFNEEENILNLKVYNALIVKYIVYLVDKNGFHNPDYIWIEKNNPVFMSTDDYIFKFDIDAIINDKDDYILKIGESDLTETICSTEELCSILLNAEKELQNINIKTNYSKNYILIAIHKGKTVKLKKGNAFVNNRVREIEARFLGFNAEKSKNFKYKGKDYLVCFIDDNLLPGKYTLEDLNSEEILLMEKIKEDN